MAPRLLRFVIVSVVFWVLINLVAVFQLSDDQRAKGASKIRNSIASLIGTNKQSLKSVGDGNGGEPLEIEPPEDSGSDDDDDVNTNKNIVASTMAPQHHHQHKNNDQHQDTHLKQDSPAKPKEKKGDPLPRSVGNSKTAAKTTAVTIRAPELRFLVVGDWGGPGREPQRNVAKSMDALVTADAMHHIQFVISTGDNMYEDGVSDVHDRKFKRNFEDVYTQPSLQCRWYMSLGNHDHGAHGVMRNAQVEVNYTQHSSRWFLPSTYYSQLFHVKGDSDGEKKAHSYDVELFVLDTYDYSPRVTQMTDAQLKWFEKALASSTADVKIVVGHRPLFSAGAKHGSSPYMQKKLEPLFTKYAVSAYLCGDDHELQVMQSKGVLHLLSGGGARAKKDLKPNGIPQTIFQAGVHGFMWVAIRPTQIVVEVHNQYGEQLYKGEHPTQTSPKVS